MGVPRRGIVLYVHGYGSCTHKMAYLAEYFAQRGYEFAGIDQRGFGKSEGVRGRIESLESTMKDV